MTSGPPDRRDATIVAVVRAAVPDAVAVYRFGSSVAGTDRPDSDVDVAVLAAQPLEPLDRFDLQERIASAIHRSVDLVDLRRASTVMASQVVTTGVVIDDLDPDLRGRFEDYVFSAYARLNEERRGILERVATEGTVYGG
jgi:uncharacterized protein